METRGGVLNNPTNVIAYRIRSALSRPPLDPVTIYDAAGTPIATMDPLTRQRTPIGVAPCRRGT